MLFIRKYYKGIKRFNWYCALHITDVYSKYACVLSLKNKEGITITSAFQKKLNDSTHKPWKIWGNKAS